MDCFEETSRPLSSGGTRAEKWMAVDLKGQWGLIGRRAQARIFFKYIYDKIEVSMAWK